VTRLWPVGLPISVIGAGIEDNVEDGSVFDSSVLDGSVLDGTRPAGFTWQNQIHQVAEITREWRVDIDWWRVRVWRAYFKLSTNTGLLVIIYQDLLSGEWYLQRLYD
jgi:hypothetical protein